MANLFSGHIKATTYTDVETLTDLSFTAGTVYTMQVLYSAWIREGEIGTGFYVSSEVFQYKAGESTLYIKGDCALNIAD